MNKKRLKNAEHLAGRPYQIRIFADETADGESGYYAIVPELPGCVSDGATVEEAKQNLDSARVDFIYFLLEDGLTVPDPQLVDSTVRIDMHEYIGTQYGISQQKGLIDARIISA